MFRILYPGVGSNSFVRHFDFPSIFTQDERGEWLGVKVPDVGMKAPRLYVARAPCMRTLHGPVSYGREKLCGTCQSCV